LKGGKQLGVRFSFRIEEGFLSHNVGLGIVDS